MCYAVNLSSPAPFTDAGAYEYVPRLIPPLQTSTTLNQTRPNSSQSPQTLYSLPPNGTTDPTSSKSETMPKRQKKSHVFDTHKWKPKKANPKPKQQKPTTALSTCGDKALENTSAFDCYEENKELEHISAFDFYEENKLLESLARLRSSAKRPRTIEGDGHSPDSADITVKSNAIKMSNGQLLEGCLPVVESEEIPTIQFSKPSQITSSDCNASGQLTTPKPTQKLIQWPEAHPEESDLENSQLVLRPKSASLSHSEQPTTSTDKSSTAVAKLPDQSTRSAPPPPTNMVIKARQNSNASESEDVNTTYAQSSTSTYRRNPANARFRGVSAPFPRGGQAIERLGPSMMFKLFE